MNDLAAPPPSAIAELWRYHARHDLDRRPPPWLVERANAQHEAERAARTPLLDAPTGVAEGELHEAAVTMVRFADRRLYEDKIAACLEAIGRDEDAAKLHTCRRHANFMRRSSDAKLIPFFDAKCRRARFCPDEAREEAARTTKRDLPRVRAWLARKDRRRRAFFMTIAPPLVPRGRLACFERELFEVFDGWRRSAAGKNIKLARVVIEAPRSPLGLWHPHLHSVIGVEGSFSYDVVRAAINRRLRKRLPLVPSDVLRRPTAGEVVRVESMCYAPGAVREVRRGKARRFECDPSRDVARLSDGSELSVAEFRAAFARGELAWAYKLRYRVSGRELRIAAVRHASGADRGRDVVEFADDAGEMPLSKLNDLVACGKLAWCDEPMSSQIDFQELDRDPRKLGKAYRELVKYMMKHTELLKLFDEAPKAFKEWCEAGDNFRRSRAYGELHGAGDEPAGKAEVSALRPVGTGCYDAGRGDYELHLGGRRFWAREEVARHGAVDLILADRSAVTKAYKSAAGERALAAQGCYDGGFYAATGPPERVSGLPDYIGGGCDVPY